VGEHSEPKTKCEIIHFFEEIIHSTIEKNVLKQKINVLKVVKKCIKTKLTFQKIHLKGEKNEKY